MDSDFGAEIQGVYVKQRSRQALLLCEQFGLAYEPVMPFARLRLPLISSLFFSFPHMKRGKKKKIHVS